MSLSGIRVQDRPHAAVHEFSTRARVPRPDGRTRNVIRCVRGRRNPRSASCGNSNNSVRPIQRETCILTRYLCSPDSWAQPSKGTRGNHRSESLLADGGKSRAVQSHSSLALGEFVPRSNRARRSDIRGSIQPWNRIGDSGAEVGFRAPRSTVHHLPCFQSEGSF